MEKTKIACFFAATLSLMGSSTYAGPVNPDCTAEKAAKSAAMKATVGVGGRCSAKEAAADTAKDAAGIEEKGAIEKKREKEGTAKKATKKALD